jgi:homopolymeric O-antigen transport system permease protein
MFEEAGAGVIEIERGLMGWRIWLMLAWNDIRRRYRRSGLGQFWLTLSMASMIGGLGYVYSGLFGNDITMYLPYLAVSFVMWNLISGIVNDSCTAFSDNENLIRHMNLSKSLYIYRVVARNTIVMAHNFVIIPIVFVLFRRGLNANILWLPIGLALVIINGFCIGFFLAIISTRFRDVPQIVASVMQIAFFITPVMFQPEQLQHRVPFAIIFNPFASLLEIVRDPLLGQGPSAWALLTSVMVAVVGYACLLPFVGRYAARAVYWL